MIDFTALFDDVAKTRIAPWLEQLPSQLDEAIYSSKNGNVPKWMNVLQQLPGIQTTHLALDADTVRIGDAAECDEEDRAQIEQLLRQLHPWRKGPFSVFGVHINTEWRSDWKWERLSSHIAPLDGRLVLDVGCGSGYYCLRMAGAGAKSVIGIDPSLLFNLQFQAIRRFMASPPTVHVLPFAMEAIPPRLRAFDTVFSMGVLYHRRSPFDHLIELRDSLKPGGELVIETLVIDGECGQVLVPEHRYAKMRNVWFIPSCATLETWLKRCGFEHVRLINVSTTTPQEQRSTDWMQYESLSDFLDAVNPELTVEGYPAPIRAIFLATSP